MELGLAFVLLCAFGGFGAVMGGIVIWALKRSRWRNERLAKIGAGLGLSPEGGGRIAGVRGGVHCTVRYVTEGSGDDRSSWTYTEAEIDPPLRLGLNLRKRGWLGQAFSELFGAKDLRVGDSAFDGSFALGAVEDAEVHRLFDTPFRSSLIRAHGALRRLWMTDDRIHASFSGFSTDQRQITAYLDTVIQLADEARRARRAMGPTARERAVLESWGALAGASGFRFDPGSLVLEGERGRHRFSIVPTLGASGWSTRFRVGFDRPLGVALELEKEHALASVGRLFGMKDIEVGDPRFDDVFAIRGNDPDAVRHLLGEAGLRESLLSLFAAAQSIEVHDDYVDAVARGLITDGAALSQSLSKVVEVAEGLRTRVDAPRVGAYR